MFSFLFVILIAPLITSLISLLFNKNLSFKVLALFSVGALLISLSASLYSCYQLLSFSGVFFFDISETYKIYLFCSPNGLQVNINFIFDELCLFMCILVLIVSLCVHIYSIEYMFFDPNRNLFLGYLSLFTFFMLVLVTSGNFIQFFIGWEGIGLCSFLLINFWYMRLEANKAAIKAVVVNKIGDCAFIIGCGLIYYYFKTFNFYTVLSILSDQKLMFFVFFKTFFFFELDGLTILAFFFLIAVMAKSAQIGLHTWLPDAMEGPTPVSALIHAATMVTAGIFFVIRCSTIFEFVPSILTMMVLIGSLTAFMAATIASVQTDIKRIIAYSTCSQLGYMLAGCGLSKYGLSFFHLFTHGFFKALLFLCAGALIHGFYEIQESIAWNQKDNYEWNNLDFLEFCLFVGSSALSATFFFSGYYSKELIISSNYFSINSSNWIMLFSFVLLVLTAILTGSYSNSLEVPEDDVFLLKNNSSNKNGHTSMVFINISLFILTFFSTVTGGFFSDYFLFFNNSMYITDYIAEGETGSWIWLWTTTLGLFLFITSAFSNPSFESVERPYGYKPKPIEIVDVSRAQFRKIKNLWKYVNSKRRFDIKDPDEKLKFFQTLRQQERILTKQLWKKLYPIEPKKKLSLQEKLKLVENISDEEYYYTLFTGRIGLFLYSLWYFDVFFNNLILKLFKWMYKVFYLLDVYLFEWFGVKGIVFAFKRFSTMFLWLQTGSLFFYLFVSIFCVMVISLFFYFITVVLWGM